MPSSRTLRHIRPPGLSAIPGSRSADISPARGSMREIGPYWIDPNGERHRGVSVEQHQRELKNEKV